MADMIVKICMLGDAAVGKTSLIRRYVLDDFRDSYLSTIGAKVMKKDVTVRYKGLDSQVSMMIWDLMGQQEFEFLQSTYYRGANGGLLVADLTRHETLDNIKRWHQGFTRINKDVPLILACNKSDLQAQYDFGEEDIRALANDLGMPYRMTSANTGYNVEKCFRYLAEEAVKRC